MERRCGAGGLAPRDRQPEGLPVTIEESTPLRCPTYPVVSWGWSSPKSGGATTWELVVSAATMLGIPSLRC